MEERVGNMNMKSPVKMTINLKLIFLLSAIADFDRFDLSLDKSPEIRLQ